MIGLSSHGFARISQMKVGIDEVVAAMKDPAMSYPGPRSHGPGRRVSVQGRVAVVHTDDENPTIITVLWNGESGRTDTRSATGADLQT
jgi:hypothetical protein